MSRIEIKKIDITELETDAIVNAANERLWAGGGVCGTIFRAAGRAQLAAACARIGYCDTGSAVLTPGFRLKAKYILHAVGPRWRDGGHDEPQLLYAAYRRALELAVQHGCRSIGFPLISAGIFGYPVDRAWEVALRACRDFLAGGAQIDVVFAVLSDEVLAVGRGLLDEAAPAGISDADERLRRISEMEARLNRLRAWLEQPAGDVREDVRLLDAYYRSPLWRADFEADEAGALPADLPRGVLSEDAVYNALTAYEEQKA